MSSEGTKDVQVRHPTEGLMPSIRSALNSLWDPADALGLCIFRILWGLIMAYEAFTFMVWDFEKLRYNYLITDLHFKYYGFEWVKVLPPTWMFLLVCSLMLLAINVTVGFFYRTSSTLFFLLFTYLYMCEAALYLNHFYLVSIICLVMPFLPANAMLSIDSKLFPASCASRTVPRWTYILLKTELVIVYTFAGVAKMNEDWLRAEPLRHWLPKRAYFPIIGRFLKTEFVFYLFSYGGLLYDSLVGFGLLFDATFPLFVVLSIGFHLTNKLIFGIGIFPWMMLATMILFMNPDWPKRLLDLKETDDGWIRLPSWEEQEQEARDRYFDEDKDNLSEFDRVAHAAEKKRRLAQKERKPKEAQSVRRRKGGKHSEKATDDADDDSVTSETNGKSADAGARKKAIEAAKKQRERYRPLRWLQILVLVLGAVFLLHQLLCPFRHLLYPGTVAWNEYGHRFSWRMKLRDKSCNGEIYMKDRQGNETIDVNIGSILFGKQARKMFSRPDLLHQMAFHVKDSFVNENPELNPDDISVHAEVYCSLNNRPKQLYVDPTFDMTATPLWQQPYPFLTEIKPLTKEEESLKLWNIYTNLFFGFPKKIHWIDVISTGQFNAGRMSYQELLAEYKRVGRLGVQQGGLDPAQEDYFSVVSKYYTLHQEARELYVDWKRKKLTRQQDSVQDEEEFENYERDVNDDIVVTIDEEEYARFFSFLMMKKLDRSTENANPDSVLGRARAHTLKHRDAGTVSPQSQLRYAVEDKMI
eukprot:TRINITY_DN5243_c0_g4_i1.p1 TRINITY_DN5243_c0_g4~~TRINITY_DN5243_c0_g4_i1.p1  ORF type:complete len:754 (+),score=193.15 TRINITY_DN5243_c0_g4_i1:163-2424(+)